MNLWVYAISKMVVGPKVRSTLAYRSPDTVETVLYRVMKISKAFFLPFLSTLVSATGIAFADSPSTFVHAVDAVVTSADVEAEAMRMTPEQRKVLFARNSNVIQLANNLLVRRQLAKQAQAKNLANDEVLKAALALAQERVLSDALLLQMDKVNTPSDDALEKYAQGTYRAEASRFEVPEQVQISHILIAKGDDAATKAEKVLNDLKAGADFASLVKSYSMDFGSVSKGGDLGLQPRGKWVPEFERAAFGMTKIGDIAGPIQTEFGLHILKLVDRKAKAMRPYAEVRESLRNEAKAKLLNDARNRESERLLKDVVVNEEAVEKFVTSQPK